MRASAIVLPFFLPAAYGQLHTLATAAGLKYFGSATDNGELSDSSYVAVLKNTSEFGQITPGNTQKWQYTEASSDVFTFEKGEVVTSFAQKNSQMLRCHNLVWYNQLPSWVSSGSWTNETLIAAMQEHITKEMTNWKGQCYAWDVVNEALDDNGNFRNDIFYSTIGPYYINIAFAAAAAADPSAKLYYNDYNIEYSGTKKTNALAIVNQIKNAGIRIDGVGIQGHYIVGSTPSQSSLESTFKEYTDLGVEVALTELDIRMKTNSAANLAQQSTEYAGVTRACLNVDGCVGITLWDFDDKYSWVPSTFSGYGYACLWNEDLTKKPAYDGVVAALKSSNRTTTASSTNSSTNGAAALSSNSTTTFLATATSKASAGKATASGFKTVTTALTTSSATDAAQTPKSAASGTTSSFAAVQTSNSSAVGVPQRKGHRSTDLTTPEHQEVSDAHCQWICVLTHLINPDKPV